MYFPNTVEVFYYLRLEEASSTLKSHGLPKPTLRGTAMPSRLRSLPLLWSGHLGAHIRGGNIKGGHVGGDIPGGDIWGGHLGGRH